MQKVFMFLFSAVLVACGGESTQPAPATSPATQPAVAAPAPSPVPALQAKPVEAPPPPEPADEAQAALDGGRYDDVCTSLVADDFSADVCKWIAATARADRNRSLTTTQLEHFLRAQHVRRVSGSIVAVLNANDNTYEVRVGGRPAVLDAGETVYETTGGFSMWAQQGPPEDVLMESGDTVSVRVYTAWPLYQSIYDLARNRDSSNAEEAKLLLGHLLDLWNVSYRYVDPNAPDPGVVAPTPDVAIAEIRALVPAAWDENDVSADVSRVVDYLNEHALRFEQLAEFPKTRLSELRADHEKRGQGWAASGGVVARVEGSNPPAIVFGRGNTCTYAIVPGAANISRFTNVSFAGVAVQEYKWRNFAGRPVPCIVAVGYLRGR
jgi:hypothetical protein